MSVVEQAIRDLEKLLPADDGRQRRVMLRILDRLRSLPRDMDYIDVRLPAETAMPSGPER